VTTSTSATGAHRKARRGWLAVLAFPGWLLWVTGIGYAQKKHCIEGIFGQTEAAVTAAERQACGETPAAWAPFRGLEFGTDQRYGEYWVAGLVLAVGFAAVVLFFAGRSSRRPRGAATGSSA
jgi:hypothetical protein